MNQTEGVNFFVILSLMADILQFANYDMNLREASNNKIMEELQRQNQDFLEVIKEQLKEIKEGLNDKTLS